MPTNATLEVFFGDGNTAKVELASAKDRFKDASVSFDHEYKRPGKYKTMFTLSNLVSSFTLKKTSFVLRRITGFTVQTTLKRNASVTGYGSNQDKFPVSETIVFKMSAQSGDVERFLVEKESSMYKETTLDEIQFSSESVSKERTNIFYSSVHWSL